MGVGLAEQERLQSLMLRCGLIAQGIRSRMTAELKADGSIVTEADRQIESLLRVELPLLVPGTTVWGEEEGFREPGEAGLWLVDPVDGTSNFAYGSPLWGISVGLYQRGEITLGAIYLPDFEEVYTSRTGGGVTCNGQMLEPIPAGPIRDEELVSYSDTTVASLGLQRLPGKMRYSGAFVVEAVWVFRQRFRGLISHKANVYDVAPSLLMASELGMDVRYLDGRQFDLDARIHERRIPDPFVIFPSNSGVVIS